MEAGSLGFGVWTIWSSGTAFFMIMTTSHVVSCYAGFSLLYRHPDNAIFWAVRQGPNNRQPQTADSSRTPDLWHDPHDPR